MTGERPACEVEGCEESATGSYLHSRVATPAIDFGICEAHYEQLKAGARPVVAPAQASNGRPVLTLVERNL